MTDGCRRLALHMGLPPDARPSDVLMVSSHRREVRRRDIIDHSVAVANVLAVSFGGGRMEDAFRHLMTQEELDAIRTAREEQEQKSAEMAQIMKLKQWGARFD